MVQTRSIEIRVTKDQHVRIKQLSVTRGFGNMSAFLRSVALEQDLKMFDKVDEIHRHLIGPEPYRPLQIRLTRAEFEKAQARRREAKFRTVAGYARSLLLGEQ